jgi:hypothetical protein
MKEFENLQDAQTLALAIVDTIPEPFLVLDDSFSVMAASRSFYECFKVDAAQTRGRSLFALGDGQWDVPALRNLMAAIVPGRAEMEASGAPFSTKMALNAGLAMLRWLACPADPQRQDFRGRHRPDRHATRRCPVIIGAGETCHT